MSVTQIAVRAEIKKCKKWGNGSKWWQEKELPPLQWFLEHDQFVLMKPYLS